MPARSTLVPLVASALLGLLGLALAPVAATRWTPQTSGVSARLRGVSVVSARVAWASGADGSVLVTTDGGATWRKRDVPGAGALDFRDVEAFDERSAYVLSIGPGESSRIYRTKDGGASWDEQFVNRDPKAFLDAMAFWDERNGIAASDSVEGRFVILLTEDGGAYWSRRPPEGLPPALPGEGAFAASGTNVAVFGKEHAWFGTTAGRVLRTSDRGRTWTAATTPLATGPTAGIFSIAFRDARHGVVVGGDYKKEGEAIDNAAFTEDGGASWQKVRGLSGFRSVVAHRPGQPGFWIAAGPNGADVSRDDARTWTPLEAPGCHAFAFARDGAAGFCVGEGGRIARLDAVDAQTDPRVPMLRGDHGPIEFRNSVPTPAR
jgi:photosystem II stability/assembly factor-like uncharacterized protein